MEQELQGLGLQNPYVNTTPEQVIAQTAPSGAVDPNSREVSFTQPTAPAYAASEADVLAAQERETGNVPAPASFLQAVPQTPGQAPGTPPQTAPGTLDWESDANPYKQTRGAAPGQIQNLRAELAALPGNATAAYNTLVAGGMDPAIAEQQVTNAAEKARLILEGNITRLAAAPAVRDHVANIIAQKFSVPGVTLSAKDLARESTPEAMEARARALVEGRRAASTQTRVVNRVDTVENSGGVTSGMRTVAQNLTPFQLIRSGLRGRSNR